ncbi:peptidoglycan D,D-transpeptidase FtsI family protein [Alicyclobacillus ferrooxydans]|nr:penicillin-binding transpeptidase domain-containing protein [Alicyclobacillus ferrooxydans]
MRKKRRKRPSQEAAPAEGQVMHPEKRSHTVRVKVVYGLIFVSFTSLILRAGYLQIAHGEYFRAQATTTSLSQVAVLPARGYIYDTHGNLLAYDKPSYNVYLTQIPHVTQDYQSMSKLLAPVFRVPADQLYQQMQQDKQLASALLFRNVSDNQVSFVIENQHDLPGVTVVLDSQRTYPQGDLAGKVLGFTGAITPQTLEMYQKLGYQPNQKVGEDGIEQQYESLLQGKIGEQVVQISASGMPIKQLGFDPPPTPGKYLKLTLDGHLQAFTQNFILQQIRGSKNNSTIQNASAVMLDVKTGGVLAMVSYPYLDPNWFPNQLGAHQKYLQKSFVQYNTAIRGPEPPGSTVKPANLLTALQHGVVSPYTQFIDHYVTEIGSSEIHDDGNHGIVSPSYAITVSCDAFFYHVGLQLGRWLGSGSSNGGGQPAGMSYTSWLHTDFIRGLNALFEGERRFGLGAMTGIDLPHENPGVFYVDKNFAKVPYNLDEAEQTMKKTGKYKNQGTPIDLAFAGIGQSQLFTPIELAQYTATIANNGIRLQPHLLEAVYTPNMQQRLTPKDKPIQVFSTHVQDDLHIPPSYMRIVQRGMYGVINNPMGTGYYAFQNAPYKAAGKTGTAQLGGGLDNSVFIAYAPYNNPQIAVAVMVPGGGYGSDIAAPIARAMMDTYFKERHQFFPADQWETTAIPADWVTSAAYQMPERSK